MPHAFTDAQLAEFLGAHPWKTSRPLADGRAFGEGKGALGNVPTDARVELVRKRIGDGKRVMEIGACEGQHSVLLAQFCREVCAVEVRPRNVVGALIRQFLWGVRNVTNVLTDARGLDPGMGKFDLIFHVGVLYHLLNPVEHLHSLKPFGDALLLDTHYATDECKKMPPSSITWQGRTWQTRKYRESGWGDAFSGVDDHSEWMQKEDLLQVVRDIGFPKIEIFRDVVERNGPRIGLLALRQ